MDENQDAAVEVNVTPEQEPLKHQLAKLVLGTLAGFLATKAVGAAYDAVRERVGHQDDIVTEDIEIDVTDQT